ncbi:DUF3375 domain-containing protein [Brevibacterium sp. CS2]|uniref:DUF3375 domain-containing protein n=1 Tax=Brevibacterium sp. CS2 TaxID=2575923 RepID=UPI0010C7D617|nr:DUF3375 domain-containing protein [Brevibacterium sp. CS2]QCP04462.1 DUF3375 domain-containing protein [Brevibacterium sp. CS2]
MDVLTQALAHRRLLEDDAAWAFLRSDNVWFAAAVLRAHLAGSDRRLPASALFERIDADLELLRSHGHEIPGTAPHYCAEWRKNGILIRRSAESTRDETFELSPSGLTALQFIERLDSNRTTVTQSRLSNIQERLRVLVRDTDPDVETRLTALHAERDRLDARVAAVRAGEDTGLDPERAREAVEDLIALAEELPSDFARVRSALEEINHGLRAQLIENTGARSRVLDDVFRGVDHLADSEAGRSFDGFYALILEHESGSEFEANIAALLDRAFVRALDRADTRFLRRLTPMLQDRSAEVGDVMTGLTRSLRRFVQSEEFREDRAVNTEIHAARALALRLAVEIPPYRQLDVELGRTSVRIDSVTSFRLHNPADARVIEPVEMRATGTVDIEALREMARLTEIDIGELVENINETLEAARCGELDGRNREAGEGAPRTDGVTIAEVLRRHPATQGVASVVGLLDLGVGHGIREAGGESVTWSSMTGRSRRAQLDRFRFTEDVPGGRRRRRAQQRRGGA